MHKQSYAPSQFGMFGRMVALVGGASLLMSFVLGSIVPIVIAVIGLFVTLSFINGLGR